MIRNDARVDTSTQPAVPTLLSLVRDDRTLDERASQLVMLATDHGFPYYRARGTIYRGWIKLKNGGVRKGVSLLRSGSIAYRAFGAEVWMTYYIGPGESI